MTDFIHHLDTPACIVTFDGQTIDANDLMVKDSRASSKEQFLSFLSYELCFDKSKHDELLNVLLAGGTFRNKKVILRFFDNTYGVRTTNVSILSKEKRLLLFQNYGSYEISTDFVEKYNTLINDINKLKPYLNNSGKILLTELYSSYCSKVNSLEQNAAIFSITKELSILYPQLTTNELYFCSLLKSGFTSKEISILIDFNPNKVRVTIHRICKKLNIISRTKLIESFK